jgi:putative protease
MAFHEGRLQNHSHDYTDTASMSDWSYGGFIKEWHDDYFVFEVRNHMESGDVLEFLPPKSLDAIRLRMYDFTNAKTLEVVSKVSAGQGMAIQIPLSVFDKEDTTTLKNRLIVGTVARTETFDESRNTEQVKVRIQSQKMEAGIVSEKVYESTKKRISERMADTDKAKTIKSKKLAKTKEEACCGRGCNGCLVFWNDPMYAKARDLLATKKMGEKLAQKAV